MSEPLTRWMELTEESIRSINREINHLQNWSRIAQERLDRQAILLRQLLSNHNMSDEGLNPISPLWSVMPHIPGTASGPYPLSTVKVEDVPPPLDTNDSTPMEMGSSKTGTSSGGGKSQAPSSTKVYSIQYETLMKLIENLSMAVADIGRIVHENEQSS
jgi:hypothetical protein